MRILWIGLLTVTACAAPAPESSLPLKEEMLSLWFDATANWERLSTPEKCLEVLRRCHDVGVTEIVVDVKPIFGEVLYPSAIAPRMTEWNGTTNEFDRLGFLTEEGHLLGMRVLAAVNVFSEAHKQRKRGVLYQRPDWQTVLWRPEGIVKTLEVSRSKNDYAGFVNPILTGVQDYELSLIGEILRKYPVEGIVLDRMRYNDIESDFSETSLRAFGASTPSEIYVYEKGARKPGPFYARWLGWRAANIRAFAEKARRFVKATRSDAECNVYVGAWYPVYEGMGAHWASVEHEGWAPKGTGFAELMDRLYAGCYFFDVREDEVTGEVTLENGQTVAKAKWYSVEGSAKIAGEVTKRPVIGSLFVKQYAGQPRQFRRAVEMCRAKTAGVMIFDLVYIEEYNWWELLRK